MATGKTDDGEMMERSKRNQVKQVFSFLAGV